MLSKVCNVRYYQHCISKSYGATESPNRTRDLGVGIPKHLVIASLTVGFSSRISKVVVPPTGPRTPRHGSPLVLI